MTITIDEIQNQISDLQKLIDTMKNPALEVSRNFIGQYFKPYQGKQYRRMVSDEIPIWEFFMDSKKEWVILNKQDSKKLESEFLKTCTPDIIEVEESVT